jgi:hypothetical protein
MAVVAQHVLQLAKGHSGVGCSRRAPGLVVQAPWLGVVCERVVTDTCCATPPHTLQPAVAGMAQVLGSVAAVVVQHMCSCQQAAAAAAADQLCGSPTACSADAVAACGL